MPEKLYDHINEILKNRPLSISGITRELKTAGISEHRLMLTGYLRALRDLKKISETDIPPSKVYTIKEDLDNPNDDIYHLIAMHLKSIDYEIRLPVAVYLISTLCKRSVFRQELKLAGINISNLKNYLEDDEFLIRESEDSNIRKYRTEITKIDIPVNDPAYEVVTISKRLVQISGSVMAEILKDVVDMNGLIPKTQQTKLTM
ncbi:conserved hypothetical protein [Methanosalsum zhilinae DSM 4017]|uniref:Uncharacterized protein n=1 Tax=Methanosalsum zhilinae (strain DSM 4017 / NBRC 107636 / OCM 62 / WeN5) TaxID=679901 RepID=F7XLI0_METZD|nr:hypothetical protein [Methanosalsum zhilinae]AEH60709.1 conserved hypothetical protein [Methanosalsum zhilinae DSM 4017]